MREHVLRAKGLFFALAWFLVPGTGNMPAHTSLSLYLEHRCTFTIDPRNIDVQLDLTFYHPRSKAGRELMDRDKDGYVSESEEKGYLSRLGREIEGKLFLKARGNDLPLMPLLQPRLVMEDRRVDAGNPFTLRISAFARTPAWLEVGDEIAFQDALWADEPGIHSCRAEGRGGLEVLAIPGSSPLQPAGRARISRLRLAALPAAISGQADAGTDPPVGGAGPPMADRNVHFVLMILGGISILAAAGIVIGPCLWFKGR